MAELLIALSGTSLAGLTTISIRRFIRSKNTKRFLLQLAAIITCSILLYLFFYTLKTPVTEQKYAEVYFIVILYIFVLLGMATHYVYDRLEQPNMRKKFNFEAFIAPVFVSPIVFLPLLGVIQSLVGELQNLTTNTKIMLFLVAFENGYFWKVIFDQTKRARQTEKRSLTKIRTFSYSILCKFTQAISISLEAFINSIKGRAIINVTNYEENNLELELSGNLTIRFANINDEETTINLKSSQTVEETPSIVFDLGDMPRRVPISVIEKKLDGLRTLYAVYYLIYEGRAKELEVYLTQNPDGDIEKDLLKETEQLFIESISSGSWYLNVWAKAKNAYKAINSVAGLAFERGREAFLKKLEAETRLIEAQAAKAEIEVSMERFNTQKSQLEYLLEVSEKMEVHEVKERLKERLIQAAKDLNLGDQVDQYSYKMLKE